jgi:putative transposase
VVQIKLLPSVEQAAALASTMSACNAAANAVSAVAFERGVTSRNDLQKLTYGLIRGQFGLGAQAAVRTVKKVVDAYTSLRVDSHVGRPVSEEGSKSKRRAKAIPKRVTFRAESAQPFDDRMLSWQHDARTVSIWTTAGRLHGLPFAGLADQLKTLAAWRKGESDLVYRDGRWFLCAVCEVPEEPLSEPVGWIGIDRGIVNLATTSYGSNYQGRRLARYRRWQARKRAELLAKRTRSARRRLKRRARREARHAAHTNHKISKQIVAVAKRTSRGIAVEDLGGIRARVRPRRDQRVTLCSWPFHQLGEHLRCTRPAVPGSPSSRWIHGIPRSAARAVGTRHGRTGPTVTSFVVAGAVSLDLLTTSPP